MGAGAQSSKFDEICCFTFFATQGRHDILIKLKFDIQEHTTSSRAIVVHFTARRYASAVYALIVCPSVRSSVFLSVTSRSSTKMAEPIGPRK